MAGGSGFVGHILKMQRYSRDKEGMCQRDQDKTGTELMLREGLTLLSFRKGAETMKNRQHLRRTYYTPGTGQSALHVFFPFNSHNTPKLQVLLFSPSYKNETKSDHVTCPKVTKL